MRPSRRRADELRPLHFTRGFTRHAEGSVLAEFGATRVLCTASVEERQPEFLRGSARGWITAEYGMLPRATHTRGPREAAKGRQSGRTLEIQRLIGRALRAAVDLEALGPRTLTVDCDVLEADGGTRTAAISGGWIALCDALARLLAAGTLAASPLRRQVAAVSVGLWQGMAVLDLDYAEDSVADADLNLVMTGDGALIEVQGTAEGRPFERAALDALLDLAASGCAQILEAQRAVLGDHPLLAGLPPVLLEDFR